MQDPSVLERMRADWNERAREDVRYYVAFGRRGQQDDEFYASAAEVLRDLERELERLPSSLPPHMRRALEIGCGPGRLIRNMSRNFAELHGVDVSDEMIRLATEKFRKSPGIHLYHTGGADLAPLSAEQFDFVYSYAVFQHIPSREVVLSYFSEMRRVMKTGGIARFQMNGLAQGAQEINTWEGVRLTREEVARFAGEHDFQLLALEGAGTQYMWTTWRKMPAGWRAGLKNEGAMARVHRAVDAHTGEAAVPASGRFAYASFWMAELPEDCDLNHLAVAMDGAPGTLCYLGPRDRRGFSQLNVLLPEGLRTGLVPVDIAWLGKPLCPRVWLRVIPPGPLVPRICSVSDATNLMAGARIENGTVKIALEDVPDTREISASVDGLLVDGIESVCTDAHTRRFEVNFRLPETLAPGPHQIELRLGARRLRPVTIEVA